MYVTFGLWIAVALCALGFAASGFWQAFYKHARKPALASGPPLAYGLAMLVFAGLCIARAVAIWHL